MNKFQYFYWIGLSLLLSTSLQAQLGLDSLSIDSLNTLGYDPLVRIYDIDGQEYSPFEMLVPNTSNPNPSPASGPHVTTCNAGMFELFFEDVAHNTGSGFDNLTPATATTTFPTVTTVGEMRQQVICQVFSDLSAFLGQAPGTAITTTVRIKIPLSGDYANSKIGEGSSYYVVPRGTNASVLDGEIWKTINLGFDSWSTIPPNTSLNIYLIPSNPSGDFFHGYLKIYFNDNATTSAPLFHYDYNSPNTNSTLYDLYSLALHEAIHALGFASLFDGVGLSRMQSTSFAPGCSQCYTRYDGYLNSTNGGTRTELLDDANPLDPSHQILGPVIQTLAPSCSNPTYNPIVYHGFNHPVLNQPDQEVYSPSPFSEGASLTHFSCDCPSNTGYSGALLACLQAASNQRFPNQAEVNTLCDLGYQRTNSWIINGTTVANYTSCTSTPCLAIGANDYQDANGVQYVAVVDANGPVPLTITNVLDNDLFPSGSTPSILNGHVEILNGNGTVSVSGTSITYTPSTTFAGWAILAYVPSCPGSDMNGNPTYIFIKVSPQPAPCNDFNCNLICGGNLEGANIAFHRDAVDFGPVNIATFYTLTGNNNIEVDFFGFPLTLINGISPNGVITSIGIAGGGCSAVLIDGTSPLSTSSFSTSNRTFVGLTSGTFGRNPITNIYVGNNNRDGIQLNLVRPLDPIEPYTLTFWAIEDYGCSNTPEVHIYGANANSGCNNPIPLNNVLGGISMGNGCTTQLIGKAQILPSSSSNTNNAKEWHQYTVTIDPANMTNGYDRLYITLQGGLGVGYQASAFLDEFELYGDNTMAVNITTTTNTPHPCISNQGYMDVFTIDYEVCLDDPLQVTNANDIDLQVDLNGFNVLGGDFNNLGELTIPAGSQTTQCATYSIMLTAAIPNNIVPGAVLNFPIALTNTGASCITNTASTLDVDITPIQNLPLDITTSVSAGPHIVGQPVVYTIEVCNPLSVALNNLKVRDFLNPNELTFDAAASPNFTSSSVVGGNILLQTAYFSLPAAIGPTSPSCTTFTFVASPQVGARDCATSAFPIPNQASVRQRVSNCPEVLSNVVTIFPTTNRVIPASVTTLTQAISLGLLVPRAASATTPQRVAIEGSLLMDIPGGVSAGYTFASNSEIIMYSGAEMIIPAEQTVTFTKTHVHGCSEMWRRILVQRGASINVNGQSLFEQGEYAIEFEDNSIHYLSKSTFRDNYVGLYAAPSAQAKTTGGTINNLTFEGTGSSNFLPPYAGQTTVPDTWPFAGIEFHNVIALNLTKFSGNIFQKLSTGIIANQTNLTIRQGATFKNLQTVNSYGWSSNTGILMESAANPYQLIEEGFGNAPTSPITFEECLYGIFIIGDIDFEITNNRMETTLPASSSPVGIVCMGAKGRSGLIENNRIESTGGGILLFQNDDPNTSLEVVNNEITVSDGSFYGGIAFWEGEITYNPVIENNIINMFDARRGISSLFQSGALFKGNQINMFNDIIPTPPTAIGLGLIGYSNRTGISIGGSNHQLFTCNNVQGATSMTTAPWAPYDLSSYHSSTNNNNSNVFGISAWQSTGNAYECNQFDLIPNGIQVSGMPSTSNIKGNVFNRVARGLWLTNGSQIGQQFHTGNRWAWSPVSMLNGLTQAQLDAMGIAGAQNDAASFVVLQGSLFQYDGGTNVDFEPFSIKALSPTAWFTLQSSGGTSFDCNNANICNIPIPLAFANMNGTNNLSMLSDAEQSAVQNTLAPTIFPQTTIFETNKATYTKLKENSNLAPNGSAEAAFVQQKARACEGKLHRVAADCGDLNTVPQGLQNQVNQRQQQIVLGLEAIYHLDSLSLVDTVHKDSLQNLAMLEKQNIESAISQQAQVFNQEQQVLNVSADAIATRNTAIAVQYTAEENLQEVNAIYLSTIAKSIFEFDVDQIQTLDVIARECPLEGGLAVYKARSMVTFFTKVNYAALQNCGSTESLARMDHQSTAVDILGLLVPQEVKIYPNPANNYLIVEWDLNSTKSGELIIYNTLGQVVQQTTLNPREGQQEVSLPNLPSGMYICRLFFDNKAVHEEKIIIEQP